MLEIARERAAGAGVDLELRQEDMRDMSLNEPAALVHCPARVMLHLADVVLELDTGARISL